jgi:hypothetical protein
MMFSANVTTWSGSLILHLDGFIQPTRHRALRHNGAEEPHTCSGSFHPGYPHGEAPARSQFDGYTLVKFDPGRAVKTQTMLRVVGNFDATPPTSNVQERVDVNRMQRLPQLGSVVLCGAPVVGHGASVSLTARLDHIVLHMSCSTVEQTRTKSSRRTILTGVRMPDHT